MKFASIILTILLCQVLAQAQHTVTGTVTEAATGESLISAVVRDAVSGKAAVTNVYGHYSLSLDGDSAVLKVEYIGFLPQVQRVSLSEGASVDFSLQDNAYQLKGVVIKIDKGHVEEEVESTQMSQVKIKPEEVHIIPTLGGESDIIKVAQLMPGISRGGEGQSGMYVRGGTDDQNLVLLDEAVVYNLGHLFGFFSVFNSDAIKDITIIKGGFPADYGGRLSAVMDVRTREGNSRKFHAKGGVGLLSSRLTLDGPIIKDKLSYSVSGRRTYIDQVFKLAGISIPYYFYDLNGKVNYKISDKDKLFFSNYHGNDVLKVDENTFDSSGVDQQFNFGFKLGNLTSTLRWNHAYANEKLFSNITLLQTRFKYDIQGAFLDNSLLIKSQIQDYGAKAHWDYDLNPENKIKFGGFAVYHRFRPNIVNTSGVVNDFLASEEGELINSTEVSVFANNDHKLSEDLSLNYGMRLSSAIVKGKTFGGIEPRFSAKYTLGKLRSVKVSYSRMKQYMHRVSSSSVALPTDLWYPVTDEIKPQRSDQMAIGFFQGFEKLKSNLSIEGYYKNMDNLIEYKEGARLLLNDNFEEELLAGSGTAYGMEFMIRKKEGRVTGWVGYTMSWATRDFDGLNYGEEYFAKYDRRHDLSTVFMYQVTKKFSVSAIWVYSTGSRFTAQTGQYLMPNSSLTGVDIVPIYGKRNSTVMAPSHRLDLNFVIKNDPKKRFTSEWQFGVYNFYNRATPYRVDVTWGGSGYRYEQPGLFGFIPSVAYNFEF